MVVKTLLLITLLTLTGCTGFGERAKNTLENVSGLELTAEIFSNKFQIGFGITRHGDKSTEEE